ncbi:MAG: imelysin family protein [Lautropia sp.]
MKRRLVWAGSLITAALVVGSCGGGGGSTPTPAPAPGPGGSADDDARRAVLADLGEDLILPVLRALDTRAQALSAAVDALAAAPADAAARTAAQAGWRSAMTEVQRADVLQIGPGAFVTDPGGRGLRLKIYSFPQFNACGIHSAAYADQAVDDATPLDRTGMGAVEYLLFADADDAACPPAGGVDGQAKRAQHAARLVRRIAEVATQLRNAWEPAGGNFLAQLSTAGSGSMTFSTPQMAMDALASAIFYFEKQTKDRKTSAPTGITAAEVVECPTVSCPHLAESPYARHSLENIQANTQTFREVFTGVDGGRGLNALMEGVGRGDLATRFLTQITQAQDAEAALPTDFETAVAAIGDRQQCVTAAANRTGLPAVCAMQGLIDEVTDTLRAEVVSTLNLRIPDYAAGDND